MSESLPELNMDILTVTLDRQSGRVSVDYQGLNYLEAIGILVVARNQLEETAFEVETGIDYDDED